MRGSTPWGTSRRPPANVVGIESRPPSKRIRTYYLRLSSFVAEPTERRGLPRGQEHFAEMESAPPHERSAGLSRSGTSCGRSDARWGGPHLVRPIDRQPAQQIGVDPMLRRGPAGLGLWAQRFEPHQPH